MSKESSHDEEAVPILGKPRISYISQTLAAFFASLGWFITGTVLGWASPAHPDLIASGSLGSITDSDLNLVSISCMCGLILGSLAVGWNIDKYGSRKTMLILSVPCILGWVLMAVPQSLVGLAVGRLITGFCGGGFCVLAPLYISEISDAEIRGRLTTLGNAMLSVGIVYSYLVGSFVSWAWLSAACGAVAVVFFTCNVFYLRDTPHYLVEKQRMRRARRVIRWLHGPNVPETYVEENFKEVTLTVQYDSDKSIVRYFIESWKPFLVCLALFACQQLCGENAIVFYCVEILRGSTLGPNFASVLVGLSQVASVALSSLLIDKVGRKILMILSEAGMSLCCLVLGLYFYFKEQDENAMLINNPETDDELATSTLTNLQWIPEVCLILYMVMFSIGASPLPWLLMAELCPNEVKGLLSSLVSAFCWFLALIVVGTFGPLVSSLGSYTVFWGYGFLSAIGCIFSIFVLKETMGLSLYETRSCFKRK